MAFDYKKEYKVFYMPKTNPMIVDIPCMNYLAVKGKGNPNDENSEYKQSISLLYTIAYTIKMSKKKDHLIEGYFDYVVPPLEGLWWQEGKTSMDYQQKETFCFISMIRLPDFVTKGDFEWAIQEATKKKKINFSKVEFFCYEEGKCIQCMHLGSYDDEPSTIRNLHEYMEKEGYEVDLKSRYHHEIYLSDPRKCSIDRCKTVIRIPICNKKFES
ncbi:MAG: GyrI-like domain-containing protein [Prevotella sp.]|nr:GyrI-like domain-containing protein [Staphylococcus sp.]MCM1351074.1 GyrI-like domain-containing protein [Prevotella sp.]